MMSNESTAVVKLLELRSLKECIVTADAHRGRGGAIDPADTLSRRLTIARTPAANPLG
jgi:hypothetical protein